MKFLECVFLLSPTFEKIRNGEQGTQQKRLLLNGSIFTKTSDFTKDGHKKP
jgi:hypothetical protein